MATRKKTIIDTPFVETIATESVAPEAFSFDFNAFMANMPSWKRIACAWTASLLVALGVGYIGGNILGILMITAELLTGSVFLALLIYFIGVISMMYLGGKLGMYIHMEIITERIDAKFNKAKSFVTGLFSKESMVQS